MLSLGWQCMEDKGSGDLEKQFLFQFLMKKGLICKVLKSQSETEQATVRYQWLHLY